MLILKSSATYPIPFFMTDSADHITGKTGLSPTVTISKTGGAFGAAVGAVTEIANGWYVVAGNATDTNTLGALCLHATATGADPTDERHEVVAFNPQDAVRLGLTALPNVAQGSMGALPTGDATGGVNVTEIGGQAASAVAPVVFPSAVGTSTYAGGAVASVTAGVTVATNNDKTGYSLTDVEVGLTDLQSRRLIAAAAAGASSGMTASGGKAVFKDAGGNGTTRITSVLDSSGNRTTQTNTP